MAIEKKTGFTLVELLVVISISVIAIALTIPTFDALINDSARRSAIADLVSALNLARNTAISNQTTVTLCPLDENLRCVNNWSLPITVFLDPKRTKQVQNNSQIIRVVQPPQHGRLIAAAGIRNYFRFRSTGMAREAIGNFVWCPDSNNTTQASQIRINMGGRPQLARDIDGNGLIDDSSGQDLDCAAL